MTVKTIADDQGNPPAVLQSYAERDTRSEGHSDACRHLRSRLDHPGQTCENQLLELRRYEEVRGWTAKEYVDEGVSGAKDRRPA